MIRYECPLVPMSVSAPTSVPGRIPLCPGTGVGSGHRHRHEGTLVTDRNRHLCLCLCLCLVCVSRCVCRHMYMYTQAKVLPAILVTATLAATEAMAKTTKDLHHQPYYFLEGGLVNPVRRLAPDARHMQAEGAGAGGGGYLSQLSRAPPRPGRKFAPYGGYDPARRRSGKQNQSMAPAQGLQGRGAAQLAALPAVLVMAALAHAAAVARRVLAVAPRRPGAKALSALPLAATAMAVLEERAPSALRQVCDVASPKAAANNIAAWYSRLGLVKA